MCNLPYTKNGAEGKKKKKKKSKKKLKGEWDSQDEDSSDPEAPLFPAHIMKVRFHSVVVLNRA